MLKLQLVLLRMKFCDNNVVDHQVVNLNMTDGSTISHTMCAFTAYTAAGNRYAKIMGTLGEIIADMGENTIQVNVFGKEPEVIDVRTLATDFSGHGGGDNRMIEEFLDMLINESGPTKSTTSVEQSVESHYCALAAEESRLNGGAVIESLPPCPENKSVSNLSAWENSCVPTGD